MSRWFLYWIIKCDDGKKLAKEMGELTCGVLTFIIVVSCVLGVAGLVSYGVTNSEPTIIWSGTWQSFLEIYFKVAIISVIISIMVVVGLKLLHYMLPSTKELAVLWIVPPLTNTIRNSETLKNIPKKILSLADEWINELSPKKKGIIQKHRPDVKNAAKD